MTATLPDLAALKRQRPEWSGWLVVVEEALREAGTSAWDPAVPDDRRAPHATAPRLAGATLSLDLRIARNLLQRLTRVASRSGTPAMESLGGVLDADPDVLTLFAASLRQDSAPAAEVAAACGADAGALEAVLALASVPFLQACGRRWARTLSRGWREGFCPVCGAWPAFAETRGIERREFYRCSRCGGEWHARPLHCAYCGEDDHHALVSLVPETGEASASIEGCTSCRGYVKSFSRLQGCAPGTVMLDDLASVHLDVAAIEQGYARRSGLGHPLDVTVTAMQPARSFWTWKG